MEMTVTNGRGYVKSEDNKKIHDIKKAGEIAIDSLYSPIERVSYEVGNARVGQDNTYDKLILYVWTNGAITPEESVALASRILIEHFNILADLNEIADETGLMSSKAEDPNQKALETSIFSFENNPPLTYGNCCKSSDIYFLFGSSIFVSSTLNSLINASRISSKFSYLDK